MSRVVLINLLLFLLPFAIYMGFVMFRQPGRTQDEIWRDAPILWLMGAGTALVIGVMVFFVSFNREPTDGTYRPAEIRDGKIVPGQIERE